MFKAFSSNGYVYKRARQIGNDGVKVLTFDKSQSAAQFIADGIGRGGPVFARDDERADVPILDKNGELEPGALAYLVSVLSNDEQRLLGLFGVDLQALLRNEQ